MPGTMRKNKNLGTIIIISLIAVLVIWITDALYDSFISHEGQFLALLTETTTHEFFLRLFLTACFLFFGITISIILTKQNLAEAKLKQHSTAVESSMDGIAIYDRDGTYVYVNQAYASINGYASPDEVLGKSYKNAYDDKELERMGQVCMPALQKNGNWRGELMAKRKNGSVYFQEVSATMLEDGSRVCIVRDITWRKRNEERLRRSERFSNTIFDSIRDPFCIFDDDFRIIRANKAYAHLKNKKVDELIGRKCYEVLQNRSTACEGCVVGKTFHSKDPCAKDKLVALNDGTEVWVEIYTYPILDEDGNVSHVIEYTRDVTDRRKSEDEKRRLIDKLEHLSRTDGLTGLMNRRALNENLLYEIDRAKRYGGELSLILCDIDNFKKINDNYGHDAGDRALQIVSATLNTILRKSDMAGRHGGDEFMIILPETSEKGAEGLAEKLLAAVRDTNLWSQENRSVRITMSIGVACLELGKDTMDLFIKRADDAMYLSKQGGRDRITMERRGSGEAGN